MRYAIPVLAMVLVAGGATWASAALAAAPEAPATEAAAPAEADATPAGAEATADGAETAAASPTEADTESAADQPKTFTEAWIDKLAKGGRTMYVLLFFSITALAYVVERLVRLRRSAFVPARLAAEANALWQEGRFDDIEALCREHPSTLGRIIRFIVRHRDNPVSDISATAGDIAALDLRHHLRRAYPLAVVATLSPLLGLLGTVIGMIECFDVVALVGKLGDPSQLAGGISKALITTATGLVIAVPALAFYHYFKTRTNLFGDMLEREVTDIITEWLMKKKEDR